MPTRQDPNRRSRFRTSDLFLAAVFLAAATYLAIGGLAHLLGFA